MKKRIQKCFKRTRQMTIQNGKQPKHIGLTHEFQKQVKTNNRRNY